MARRKKSSAANNGQPPPADPGQLSLDENGSHDEEEDGSQLQEPSEEQPFQRIEGLERYVQNMREEHSDAYGKLKEELSASEKSGASKNQKISLLQQALAGAQSKVKTLSAHVNASKTEHVAKLNAAELTARTRVASAREDERSKASSRDSQLLDLRSQLKSLKTSNTNHTSQILRRLPLKYYTLYGILVHGIRTADL
jgi:hypothetical protein